MVSPAWKPSRRHGLPAQVLADSNRGSGFVERARGMGPTFVDRFRIYSIDRERRQRAAGEQSAGEGAMDLVSYVEFQNNFTALQKSHRAALRANRRFWRLLIRSDVSFLDLAATFESMDKTEARADRAYRAVMERYPKSVRLLRAYAGFLEEVRNNPWGARKYHEEADKLEEAAADGQGDGDGEDGGMQVNDKVDAVAVINPAGIITVVNKCLLKMFGYKTARPSPGVPWPRGHG